VPIRADGQRDVDPELLRRKCRGTCLTVGGFNEAYYCAEEVVLSRALGQQGRFVVLRESVTTSARKFRTYSTRELLTSMSRIARRGRKAMQRREGLELW
jgi:hypothetical protein